MEFFLRKFIRWLWNQFFLSPENNLANVLKEASHWVIFAGINKSLLSVWFFFRTDYYIFVQFPSSRLIFPVSYVPESCSPKYLRMWGQGAEFVDTRHICTFSSRLRNGEFWSSASSCWLICCIVGIVETVERKMASVTGGKTCLWLVINSHEETVHCGVIHLIFCEANFEYLLNRRFKRLFWCYSNCAG